MDRRASWEAAVALAMLPIGATLAVMSAAAVFVFAVSAVWTALLDASWDWSCLWCISGMLLCVFNTVATIETMSSFEWRTLRPTLVLTALLVATCPIWW